MGFISDFRRAGNKEFPGASRGRELWDRSFGRATDKETGDKPQPSQTGGSHGRGVLSSDASVKRLLQALQSMAPGSPTDNRYEQTNQYFGPTYVAIDRKSRMLSQAEFQVYRRDPRAEGGKRPVREDDPAEGGRIATPYDLVSLLKKPNRQDSFGKLMWRWSQQLNLTGVGLTWMVPNRFGTPVELYPIPTAMAVPQPAVNPEYPDGFYRIQPIYPYGPFSSYPTPNSAVGAPIGAQWMLRFLWPHPLLRYDGFSPLTGLNLEIDSLRMVNKSRHYKMRRGSNPDAVLNAESDEPTGPFSEPEIERMRAEWENEHGGPENAGKFIVGSPGWKLEPWGGPSPREMDYGQSWEQLLSFILGGGFGITKPAAGMIEDSSYASLFATIKQLYLLTLQPDCDDIAADLTRHLAPFFGDDLIIEIRCKRIDDHEVKLSKLNFLKECKALTKNEAREEMEMPLAPAAWGWGGDVCGDPSPNEKAQQEQQQQGDMLQGAAEPTEEAGLEGEGPLAGMMGGDQEPAEMQSPGTGPLGQGSMNPRKSLKRARVGEAVAQRLNGTLAKSFYDVVRETCRGRYD
jgi:phage portal protein BeeE